MLMEYPRFKIIAARVYMIRTESRQHVCRQLTPKQRRPSLLSVRAASGESDDHSKRRKRPQPPMTMARAGKETRTSSSCCHAYRHPREGSSFCVCSQEQPQCRFEQRPVQDHSSSAPVCAPASSYNGPSPGNHRERDVNEARKNEEV